MSERPKRKAALKAVSKMKNKDPDFCPDSDESSTSSINASDSDYSNIESDYCHERSATYIEVSNTVHKATTSIPLKYSTSNMDISIRPVSASASLLSNEINKNITCASNQQANHGNFMNISTSNLVTEKLGLNELHLLKTFASKAKQDGRVSINVIGEASNFNTKNIISKMSTESIGSTAPMTNKIIEISPKQIASCSENPKNQTFQSMQSLLLINSTQITNNPLLNDPSNISPSNGVSILNKEIEKSVGDTVETLNSQEKNDAFLLNRSVTIESTSPEMLNDYIITKRRPGRPRKQTIEPNPEIKNTIGDKIDSSEQSSEMLSESCSSNLNYRMRMTKGAPRGRGRPRKYPLDTVLTHEVVLDPFTGEPRKRGRPRKLPQGLTNPIPKRMGKFAIPATDFVSPVEVLKNDGPHRTYQRGENSVNENQMPVSPSNFPQQFSPEPMICSDLAAPKPRTRTKYPPRVRAEVSDVNILHDRTIRLPATVPCPSKESYANIIEPIFQMDVEEASEVESDSQDLDCYESIQPTITKYIHSDDIIINNDLIMLCENFEEECENKQVCGIADRFPISHYQSLREFGQSTKYIEYLTTVNRAKSKNIKMINEASIANKSS